MKAEIHKGQNGALIINNIHNNYKLGDGAERSLFFFLAEEQHSSTTPPANGSRQQRRQLKSTLEEPSQKVGTSKFHADSGAGDGDTVAQQGRE